MYVPDLLETVHLTGIDEFYLVTCVNLAKEQVDLLPLVYGRRPLTSVPFLFVEAVRWCGPPLSGP